MDRRIADYLPMVLRNVPEFKTLMAVEQPELEALWETQDDVLENQFLVSATELGVRRWERILKIYPKDTDGLEMRRARVLAILRLKLPYTLRWLRNWLDEMCEEGNYELAVSAYTILLNIALDCIPEAEKLAADILSLLLAVKPADMVLNLGYMRRSAAAMVLGGISEAAVTLEIWPA